MAFHWSLSDSKSPQVSRTLLRILADLNNLVVWLVSTRPLFFLDDCSKRTNYNLYKHHFHVPHFFFNSQARSRYLSFFSLSFNFTLWSTGTAKSTILQILFLLLLLLFNTKSGYLAKIRWSVRISKSHMSLCASFSRTDTGLCIIIIIIYSLVFFHISFSWWSFLGVRVTESSLKSLGLFSVFWPFSIILKFGRSPLVLRLQSSPVSLIIL